MKISKRVSKRIVETVKRFQKTVIDAKKRDISESDTSAIVAAMLSDVLGYKQFEEVTSEIPVKGTFCDLAVKVAGNVRFLVEVKAVNHELRDQNVHQAMSYGATEGIDWVVLTNAASWRAYKIVFSKPIDKILVLEVDVSTASPKSKEIIEFFGNLSREEFTPTSMGKVLRAKQAMSKHSIAALLRSDPIVAIVRRELRRRVKGLNPNVDEIRELIEEEIIKRELVEGDEAAAAAKSVRKASRAKDKARKHRRSHAGKRDGAASDEPPPSTGHH